MENISTINPAITENTKCLIIEAHVLVINISYAAEEKEMEHKWEQM